MGRPRIRGVRLRLALALLLVVAGALGVVYLIVVPSLEDELVRAKLDQLEADATTVANGFKTDFERPQEYAEIASSVVQARVVIYTVVSGRLFIQADSRTTSSLDMERNSAAIGAASSGTPARDTVEREGRRFADVAVVEGQSGSVILLSDSLSDPLSSLRF
ncbi:MAG: hypothetical protein H0V50_08655, partial [Thermoleophilaceae bacterium]|nr:hypothetical protein [Thermoleophilaceae bacterium]